MNTPLQQAASVILEAISTTDFTCRLGEQLDALEKALADEQAQAVEPVGVFDIAVTEKMAVIDYDCTKHSLKSGDKLYTHPAPPATGERAELIVELHKTAKAFNENYTVSATAKLCIKAADMLEADTAHMALSDLAGNAETMSIAYGMILKLRAENKALKAQQVAVPVERETLSPSDLFDVYCKDTSAGDWHRAEQNYVAGFRASEQHHGIGAKP